MTRQLRSQVCLADDTPILAGDDNSVTFYANLSSNPNSAQKRALRYVASREAHLRGRLHRHGHLPRR